MSQLFGQNNTTLQDWFTSRSGAEALAAEQQLLDNALKPLFGTHVVICGLPMTDLARHSGHMVYRWQFADQAAHDTRAAPLGANCFAETPRLPLRNDSIDIIVARHLFEMDPDSARLIAEFRRVLRPQGHLVVAGFDPRSPHGLARAVAGQAAHFRGTDALRPVAASQLQRRTLAAGFASVQKSQQRFSVPWQAGRWGGCYVLSLKKRVEGITPLRLLRTARRPPLRVGAAEPARTQSA